MNADTDLIPLKPFFIKFGLLLLTMFLLTHFVDAKDVTHYKGTYTGKLMANRQPYDPFAMTCASWDYPLGTMLLVSYEGRSVIVEVTDRHSTNHKPSPEESLTDIDLSFTAFCKLIDLWYDQGRLKGATIQPIYEKQPLNKTNTYKVFSLTSGT